MPAYTKFLVTYSIVLEHFLLANLEPIDILDTDLHLFNLDFDGIENSTINYGQFSLNHCIFNIFF